MGGVFYAVSGSISKFVRAWLLPSAVGVGLFSFLILPALNDLSIVQRLNELGRVERGLTLTVSALLLAFLSSYCSTSIYRFLEGYSWPKALAIRAVKRQQAVYKSLKTAALGDPAVGDQEGIEKADQGDREPSWYAELAVEKLRRYPDSEFDILPTRLGNALKKIERYGSRRYSLDSQLLWSELNACAPTETSDEVEDARSVVDFFISFVFVSFVFGLLSLAVGVSKLHVPSLIAGLVALLLSRWFYNRAVDSTTWLAGAMQALVNLGRVSLAEKYGLGLPSTLSEERKMWEALTAFTFWGDGDWSKVLDEYRLQHSDETNEI
jgi:hypothetical protein